VANPVLTEVRTKKLIKDGPFQDGASTYAVTLTRGAVVSSLLVYALVALPGTFYGWRLLTPATPTTHVNTAALWLSLIVAFITAMVISFKPHLAKGLGWFYAALEGFVIGAVSGAYNAVYPGIVLEAAGATTTTALVVWFLYGSGVVKVTNKVTRIIFLSTIGAMGFYFVAILTRLFGGPDMLNSASPLGILISLVLCTIATANLLVDFDRVDEAIAAKMPKDSSWYFAFGLFVTLVWMYLEILRLLGKARR